MSKIYSYIKTLNHCKSILHLIAFIQQKGGNIGNNFGANVPGTSKNVNNNPVNVANFVHPSNNTG